MRVKLKDNYDNEFLTTQSGKIFHKKGNKQGKPVTSHELVDDDFEMNCLFNDKILVPYTEEDKITVKEPKEEVKQLMPKVEIEVPKVKKIKEKVEKPKTLKDNTFSENVIKEVVVENKEEDDN